MDMHVLCLYCLVLLLVFPFGSSLTCYQCRNSDYPASCTTREHCQGVNKACIVTETVDSNFLLKYNLGCVDKNFCAGLPIVGEEHYIGKRTLEYQCCVTNLCNHAKPSYLPHPLQPITTTSTTHRTTTTARHSRCLTNWIQYGNHCYVLMINSAIWKKAMVLPRNGIYTCDLCHEDLRTLWVAKRHVMEVHSGFKWSCTQCGGLFKRASGNRHSCDERSCPLECYHERWDNGVLKQVVGKEAMEEYRDYRDHRIKSKISLKERYGDKEWPHQSRPRSRPSHAAAGSKDRHRSPSPLPRLPERLSPLPSSPAKRTVKSDELPSAKRRRESKFEYSSLPPSPDVHLDEVSEKETNMPLQNPTENAEPEVSTPQDAAIPPPVQPTSAHHDAESSTSTCDSDCTTCDTNDAAAAVKAKERASQILNIQGQVVRLNVGGTMFQTSRANLLGDQNMTLCKLMSMCKDPTGGVFFIDRDPKHFSVILNYLRRTGRFIKALLPRDRRELVELLEEATYYNIQGLIKVVKERLEML